MHWDSGTAEGPKNWRGVGGIVNYCSNGMTSKMRDLKIHTDLTSVKTIQYNTVSRVLEIFFCTSEEAWIFNPPFLNPLYEHSSIVEY